MAEIVTISIPTEDKKIKTLSKQSYTEHGITCENGVYNIKLFVDDIFENNISEAVEKIGYFKVYGK